MAIFPLESIARALRPDGLATGQGHRPILGAARLPSASSVVPMVFTVRRTD
jgi:hypothetical protein